MTHLVCFHKFSYNKFLGTCDIWFIQLCANFRMKLFTILSSNHGAVVIIDWMLFGRSLWADSLCTYGSCPHTCGPYSAKVCPKYFFRINLDLVHNHLLQTAKCWSTIWWKNKSTVFYILYYSSDCGDGHVCTAITIYFSNHTFWELREIPICLDPMIIGQRN